MRDICSRLPRAIDPDELASILWPGKRVFIQGAASESPVIRCARNPLAAIDYVLHADSPLPEFLDDVVDVTSACIGQHVAALARDSDRIQLGIGKIAATMLSGLKAHHSLGLHTGLITDGAVALVKSGVLNGARRPAGRGLVTGAFAGTRTLYALARDTGFFLTGTQEKNSPLVLASIDNFVSINSALEVDLFGQVNSETLRGWQVSGSGGALDFARGAALSRGGRSIIAMPYTTRDGRNRILRHFARGIPSTIGRSDVGIIVTEYVTADLRGKTTPARVRGF